jgi:hypothetical protein
MLKNSVLKAGNWPISESKLVNKVRKRNAEEQYLRQAIGQLVKAN